jgi:hypothetical protein
VGEIILNLQFYISHIRPKSVTIGKKIFAASQAAILLTKENSNATARKLQFRIC